MRLYTCKPGSETFLRRELDMCGVRTCTAGEGWLLADPADADTNRTPDPDLCFAVFSVMDAREVTAPSVNALATVLCDCFHDCCRNHRFEESWPLLFQAVTDADIAGRMRTVRAEFAKRLRGKMSRVAKFATGDLPDAGTEQRGFFVLFLDYSRVIAGSTVRFGGQRRMKDDPGAPSRSYLKVEEAYGILGVEPAAGETVVDLGGAPGGWSYSAAKRGADVCTVDNGPLKGAAAGHPNIMHMREDAFRFRPDGEAARDWLFCDLIESPYRVLDGIVLPWLDNGWCSRFVVNLKVGKSDPVELLRKLRGDSPLSLDRRCSRLTIRELYHDRDEITCVGIAAPTA